MFTGLLLIVIGALFLFDRFHPLIGLGHLIRLFWPVLIILWGVAKLFDHLAARNTGQAGPSLLSGPEAAVLVLLVFVLLGFVFRDYIRQHFPDWDADVDLTPFHQSYSQSQELAPQTIPSGAHLSVETSKGNITVHAGEGSALQVSVNESASAGSESDADARMKNVQVVIDHTGNAYSVRPVHQDDSRPGVTVDLDIQVPKQTSFSAHTAHGDISASGIGGAIDVRSENGGVDVHDVGSDVTVSMEKGDARISRADGNVKLTGRGNDIEIADVSGDALIEGDFFGSTRVSKVNKTTRFTSPHTALAAVHLNGRIELSSDNLEISDVAGVVNLVTRDKDIQIDDVAGELNVDNSHGDIKITCSTPPRGPVNIKNDSGEVALTLPAKSGFAISAVSRSGDVDTDFEGPMLKESDESGSGELSGQVGTPGPKIPNNTSYGTIELRKFENTPTGPDTRPGHLPTAFRFLDRRHRHPFAARVRQIL